MPKKKTKTAYPHKLNVGLRKDQYDALYQAFKLTNRPMADIAREGIEQNAKRVKREANR